MKEEYRQIKIRLDKSDNSNRELDDQTAQLNKKDLQIQALKLEVDEQLKCLGKRRTKGLSFKTNLMKQKTRCVELPEMMQI